MSSSPLKSVVDHDGRLDILCCLSDEALTIAQVCATTGRVERYVRHHLQILGSFGLVESEGEEDDGHALYVANLKGHPAWVAKMVKEHCPTT